jgi:hypothetical protein
LAPANRELGIRSQSRTSSRESRQCTQATRSLLITMSSSFLSIVSLRVSTLLRPTKVEWHEVIPLISLTYKPLTSSGHRVSSTGHCPAGQYQRPAPMSCTCLPICFSLNLSHTSKNFLGPMYLHLPNSWRPSWRKLVDHGEGQLEQTRSLLDAWGAGLNPRDYNLVQEQLS